MPTNKPLLSLVPREPEASTYSPEVRKLIQSNAMKKAVKSLSQAVSVLEIGLKPFFQLEPKTTSGDPESTADRPVGVRDSVIETRSLIQLFFETTDTQRFLDNPTLFEYVPSLNKKKPEQTTLQLRSALTRCRNSLKGLLKFQDQLKQEKWDEAPLGNRALGRLAMLSRLLNELDLGLPTSAETVVRIRPEKQARPPKQPSAPKAKTREMAPVNREKARELLDLFYNNQDTFKNSFIYELSKEIAIHMEEEGAWPTFKDLRDLFECPSRKVEEGLIRLKKDLQRFNIGLGGTFEPNSPTPITLETEVQQEPSTQSIN